MPEVSKHKTGSRLMNAIRSVLHHYFFSIHHFLSFSLLSILLCIIAVLGFFNYHQISKQNQHIFETQLISSAELLDALTSIKIKDQQTAELTELLQQSARLTVSELLEENSQEALSYYIRYQDVLIFQVWDMMTNQLMIKSENAPTEPISNIPFGFQTTTLQHETWDSFTLSNDTNNTRIIIATRSDFHETLNEQLFFKDLIFLVLFYIITSAIILITIALGLKHLKQITHAVAIRDPNNLEPLDPKAAPVEIEPLIEELNLLFEKLTETFTRERRFTADAAHELRTPLAAIKTHAEIALRTQEPEIIKKAIGNIIQGCNRSAHAVEQLLTLSRLEPEASLQVQEVFDLNEVTAELIAEVAINALKKEIDLSLETLENKSWIKGSRSALGILIRNLVDNAIRYSPRHSNVNVIIESSSLFTILRVIDSGPGVPLDMRERIFDRFYRQIGNKEEGSGLGLSIVSNIVRLHGGSIQALDAPSGTGLEMRVSLPKINIHHEEHVE